MDLLWKPFLFYFCYMPGDGAALRMGGPSRPAETTAIY